MDACFLRSTPSRRANACRSSQLLSSGPPATASFLPRRLMIARIGDCAGTITAIKDEIIAERTLARDPKPIRKHEVGRAALERDLAGSGRSELDGIDRKIKLAIEPVRPDDVELPS